MNNFTKNGTLILCTIVFTNVSSFSQEVKYLALDTLDNTFDINKSITILRSSEESLHFPQYHMPRKKNGQVSTNRKRFYQMKQSLVMLSVLFKKYALFNDTDFVKDISFYDVGFSESAIFRNSQFHGKVNFLKNWANNEITFESAFFNKGAIFKSLTSNKLNFRYTNFVQSVTFSDIEAKIGDFRNSHFNSKVYFDNVNIKKQVIFSHTIFSDSAKFNNFILPEYLDFSNMKTKYEIDLTDAKLSKFGTLTRINLIGTDVDKLKLNFNNFIFVVPNSYLDLPFDEAYGEINNTLEKLLLKLSNDGYIESYEIAYMIQQSLSAYLEKNPVVRFLKNAKHFIQVYWWRYGFSKEYIFIWTFVFLIIFFIINTLKFKHLFKYVYEVKGLNTTSTKKILRQGKNSRFYKSILPISLLYTFYIFFGMKLDVNQLKHPTIWTYYIFTVYVTGLVCLAYIANFIFVR